MDAPATGLGHARFRAARLGRARRRRPQAGRRVRLFGRRFYRPGAGWRQTRSFSRGAVVQNPCAHLHLPNRPRARLGHGPARCCGLGRRRAHTGCGRGRASAGFCVHQGRAGIGEHPQSSSGRRRDDHVLPVSDYAGAVRAAWPGPLDYRLVPGADHFDFLAPCSPALAEAAPPICQDRGFDRTAFHARFNAAVVALFQQALRLNRPYAGLTLSSMPSYATSNPAASTARRSGEPSSSMGLVLLM